jgi:hypothetical protein
VLLGAVLLTILFCVIIINNLSGEIDNMIVFGQTDDGRDIGGESKDASNNDDKKLAIITLMMERRAK